MSIEPLSNLGALLEGYRRNPGHVGTINSAAVLEDLAEAQREMNTRLDGVIPSRYRNAGVENPQIKDWVSEYADDPAAARSLLIMGPTGSGKTWAGYGALRAAAVLGLRPNRAGRYILGTWMTSTHADFLAHMRPGYFAQRDDLSTEKYMLSLRTTPLLMFDDLGISKGSEFAEESTHRLISGRYDDERPSIYTTNLAPKDLAAAVGDRIASRLVGQCLRVNLIGGDRRRSGQ